MGLFFLKWGYRKKGSGLLPFRYVLLWTTIVFIVINAVGIWVVNQKIRPTLIQYAEAETKKIAMLVINDAIKHKVATNNDLNSIMSTFPNDTPTGTLQFDTQKINQIQADITSVIQDNLEQMEEGRLTEVKQRSGIEIKQDHDGIVYSLPLGLATKNAFLANLGPNIPIKFRMIGEVETDVVPEIKPYGINNAFVRVVVEAKVHVSTIAPFSTKTTTVTTNIPVAMGMVQGDVPSLYHHLLPGLNP